MGVWWFSRIIAQYPYPILITVLIFSTTCLVVPLVTNEFPDFSDPQLGFEARGTELAQRFTAWKNLMDATGVRGALIDNVIEYFNYLEQLNSQNNSEPRRKVTQGIVRKKPKPEKRKKGKKYLKKKNGTDENTGEEKDKWKELENFNSHKSHTHLGNDGFFCNAPSSAYARIVIGSERGDKNMWSMDGVLAQCHIDDILRKNPKFSSLCQTYSDHSRGKDEYCRSWSPANYVAMLSNRTSCLSITEDDLYKVEMLLKRCAYYYNTNHLTEDCAENLHCQAKVPPECYTHNALYHLLHYLLDIDFLPADTPASLNYENATLKTLMIFLPMAASSKSLDFYQEVRENDLVYHEFRILGMELGLKSTLFDSLLVSDSCLLLAGFVFVTMCIWAYTSSILLTVSTILAVVFSLGISYAIYTMALGIKFFPFMNFLAIVVAVGIGADDAFIYCKVWESGKQRKISQDGLMKLVQETMKHAVPSMFVTSVTTAVAFFASIVSNVTAINCFSLFSGMTVIANFFLMVTWLPASMVISERFDSITLPPTSYIVQKIIRPFRFFKKKALRKSNQYLMHLVLGLRWIWLPILTAIAAAGCTVVFYYPGLRLPDSQNFQLFDRFHLFEVYDFIYAKRFNFEKSEMDSSETLPLRFVWGIKPVDNGDYLNPSSRGALEWDESFNMTTPESQIWLQQFCHDLRAQPFYLNRMGPLLSNCFIESLTSWMSRQCEDVIDPKINRAPCCKSSEFPYTPDVLRQCVAEANADLYRTPKDLWTRGGTVAGGVKFLKDSLQLPTHSSNDTKAIIPLPKIMALIVEYDSTQPYSLSFAEMDQFYNQVENWMQKQLQTAPVGMQKGWFVSRLEFYELQRTLYEGTLWAMGVSMILALIVLAFVTLNPLVSLYAILAIGAAIIVTVASLVLLGWKLNVLESVAVSTAIGLAVDFSLHYAVSYRVCKSPDRIERVKAALEQMAGPSLMAAVTSGAAGAFMLPSHVLAYIQIGIFLILVMSISWIYATFFLCPLLAVAGPSFNFAQFHYSSIRRVFRCFQKNVDDDMMEINRQNRASRNRGARGRGMLSESTLSTSSTACQLNSPESEGLFDIYALPRGFVDSPMEFQTNERTRLNRRDREGEGRIPKI